jgi:hypothetical protein
MYPTEAFIQLRLFGYGLGSWIISVSEFWAGSVLGILYEQFCVWTWMEIQDAGFVGPTQLPKTQIRETSVGPIHYFSVLIRVDHMVFWVTHRPNGR